MLQRVQSIYLTAGLICTGLLFYFTLRNGKETSSFSSLEANSNLYLSLLLSLIGSIQLINIFLFRNRKIQLKFCFTSILLAVGYTSFFFILFKQENKVLTNFSSETQWAIILPLLIILLTYLAMRSIRKDEELIRSTNRLR